MSIFYVLKLVSIFLIFPPLDCRPLLFSASDSKSMYKTGLVASLECLREREGERESQTDRQIVYPDMYPDRVEPNLVSGQKQF